MQKNDFAFRWVIRMAACIMLSVSPFVLSAQDGLTDLQHLRFKGVSIDGSRMAVVSSLKDEGFSLVENRQDVSFMKGMFAGFDNVLVSVVSTKDQVWKVTADIPGFDTWTSVKRVYELFKRSYENKYGVTPSCSEFFPAYVPEGSGREAAAFRDETGVWQSVFSVENGDIVLSVQASVSGPGRFLVRMEYVDSFNSYLHDSVLLNDI